MEKPIIRDILHQKNNKTIMWSDRRGGEISLGKTLAFTLKNSAIKEYPLRANEIGEKTPMYGHMFLGLF